MLASSARLAETNSKSGSESNSARNPTKRSGSLSTTAMRIALLVEVVFIAVAAFIAMPVLGLRVSLGYMYSKVMQGSVTRCELRE